jgi:hypothetical protein
MRKGSPEAKAWGRKMKRLREGGKRMVKRTSEKARKYTRHRKMGKTFRIIPDGIGAIGIGYGIDEVLKGNLKAGAIDGAIGVIGDFAAREIGKFVPIGHKSRKIAGVNMKWL